MLGSVAVRNFRAEVSDEQEEALIRVLVGTSQLRPDCGDDSGEPSVRSGFR